MGALDGAVLGAVPVVERGPADRRFDVVLVGDGYRGAELPLFADHVRSFCQRFFRAAPFDVLRGAINVYRIDVVSVDSGADEPAGCPDGTVGGGRAARTFFDATYCGGSSRRLLTVDADAVLAVVAAHVPAYDMVFVQVNAAAYGGSGGAVAVFSTHPDAVEIGLHEMGHTAFGLGDEYAAKSGGADRPAGERHPGPEPDYPNVTLSGDRAGLKWADLVLPTTPLPTTSTPDCSRPDEQSSPVPPGTVGAFEGADYHRCGAYRPEYDCRMRTLGQPFCAVCRREIRRQVLRYVNPPR